MNDFTKIYNIKHYCTQYFFPILSVASTFYKIKNETIVRKLLC